MPFSEWDKLAEQCADSLFDIGAYGIGAVVPAVDGQYAGFSVPGYSKEFVFTRSAVVSYGGVDYIETRFVVLTAEEFPELHRLRARLMNESGTLAARRRIRASHRTLSE